MQRLLFTLFISMTLALGAAVTMPACAGNQAPVLIGQSGLALSGSIDQISAAVLDLTKQQIVPPAPSVKIQETLVAINAKLKPLPAIIRTMERLQDADAADASQVDQAIDILTIVGQDLSGLLVGVPLAETTSNLVKLVRASQNIVQTTLIEVARIKGAN